MARTRRRLSPAPAGAEAGPDITRDEFLPALLEKARGLSARIAQLKADAAGAARLTHDAQVREALTRSELTLALHESLAARAALEARLRDRALAAYCARGGERTLRRRNRPSRLLDRILIRLGAVGQALVVARSGVGRSTFFDRAFYLAANPDVAEAGTDPLAHYLAAGGFEGRSASPLLHEAYYRTENAHELAAAGLTCLEHYLRVGAARGRSPHPLFDAAYYLAQEPDLGPGEDPLAHYLRDGWRRGLDPHPLFDSAWYAGQGSLDAAAGGGLAHYLTAGWREGRSPHPLFDPPWYLERNPAVAETGVEPLTHFLVEGARAGCSPSPWFDLPAYVEARGGALPADANPLVDYLQGGAWALAEVRCDVPTAAYPVSRPGLARGGVTPLEHWARRGGR
jgi:hypothetical protein